MDSGDISRFVDSRHRTPEAAPEPPRYPGDALRFSIVMPSFRHGRFIERSLLSVLNQNHTATELIVIDGGSEDETPGLLERYGAEIAYACSERDRGQSDALNKGFARASGDIFGWLNSDDLYLPGAFRAAAEVFASHPEVEVVYGDWYTIDPEERILEHFAGLRYSPGRHITEGVFCNAQSLFWRRSLHQRLPPFDVDLHYTMDYDLVLQMILAAGGAQAFRRLPRALGCFRVYAGQKTGSADDRVALEHQRIAKRAGTAWKYGPRGHLLRLLYRLTRVVEHLARGRSDYLVARLRARRGAPAA